MKNLQKNKNNIKQNLYKILNTVKEAQKKHKNAAKKIKIITATKNQTLEKIQKALKEGLKIIGENRIQEAEAKQIASKIKAEKHFIGHLQSNKTKKAIQIFDVIQTADSIKIIKKINEQAKKINKKQKIMIQINTGRDEKKYGFMPEEINDIHVQIKRLKNIKIIGIMTIAPRNKTKKELRKIFKETKKIQIKTNKNIKECINISMGMSGDYVEAIAEGSTHIRIGRALFGK